MEFSIISFTAGLFAGFILSILITKFGMNPLLAGVLIIRSIRTDMALDLEEKGILNHQLLDSLVSDLVYRVANSDNNFLSDSSIRNIPKGKRKVVAEVLDKYTNILTDKVFGYDLQRRKRISREVSLAASDIRKHLPKGGKS